MIEAVVFDLDGILIDSEHVWDEVRQQLAEERGGRWNENASRDMMGMSSIEWSRVHARRRRAHGGARGDLRRGRPPARGPLPPRAAAHRRRRAGGREAGRSLAARARLVVQPRADRPRPRELGPRPLLRGNASRRRRSPAASPRRTSSSRRPAALALGPTRCAAVEDSENGILAAKAAGMRTIAIPNPHYPPHEDALAAADVVLASIEELTPGGRRGLVLDPRFQVRTAGEPSLVADGSSSTPRSSSHWNPRLDRT